MSHRFPAFVVLLFLLCAPYVRADEPVRWDWSEGEQARFVMLQTREMSLDAGLAGKIDSTTNQAMLLDWNVEKVSPEGVATIAQSVKRVVMKSEGPQDFSYDSASAESPTGVATLVEPMFRATMAGPYLVTMLPSGEITEVELSEELDFGIQDAPEGSISPEAISQMAKQSAIVFPDKELSPGEAWTTEIVSELPKIGVMNLTGSYTYQGPKTIEGRTYESFAMETKVNSVETLDESIVADIKITNSEGELLFDRELGRLHSTRLTTTMDVKITVPTQLGNQSVANQMTQTISLQAVPEGDEPELRAMIGLEPVEPVEN